LVVEALDRLDGKFQEFSYDKILHDKYIGLFKKGHYSYEAASRIGVCFLRRHKDLLGLTI